MSTSQASVAERRARIEKLKKERDQKEADRKINEAREAQQKNENELLDIAEKQGYQTMSGVASRFIESGELSPEEYLRVIPRSEEMLGED